VLLRGAPDTLQPTIRTGSCILHFAFCDFTLEEPVLVCVNASSGNRLTRNGESMTTPYITLVTPAMNMSRTVRQTLESVKSAKTSTTEYIFVDGGSTDLTLDLVASFGDTVDLLISEPDEGQYYAIAKGLNAAQGEIHGWINADDVIMPWTLRLVEHLFRKFPEVHWITGLPSFLDRDGSLVKVYTKPAAYPRRYIRNGWFDRLHGGFLQQESMFWRRSLYDRCGGLDLSLSLAADFALWAAFAEHAELYPTDVPLGAFRELPGEQRSSRESAKYDAEVSSIQASRPSVRKAWKMAAGGGQVARALARLAITRNSPLITYDRSQHEWHIVRRRRSISRQSIAALLDMKS
jgi:hypothetical protein